MREAIIENLKKIYPTYNITRHDSGTLKKPFLVLKMDSDIQTITGSFSTFNVYVYAPIKAPLMLDVATKKVISSLNKKRLKKLSTEGSFFIEYTGAIGDFIEEKTDSLGRIIEFRIPKAKGSF